MKRWILFASAGLLVVAGLVTGGLRGWASVSTTTTSTTTTTTPLATWYDPAEIIVPPTAVVPTAIELDGGLLVVDYDLLPMGGDQDVRPTGWTLLAGDTEYPATIEPTSTRVGFDVGFDFDSAAITGLRLDRYVMRSPIQAPFEPAPTDFSTHAIAPGVSATLDIVQEQTDGAIVRVQLRAEHVGAVDDLAAEGVGPGWVTASSNFGGNGLWTLSFDGDTLPDPLPLVVRGILWVDVETSVVSDLAGVPIG